MTPARDRSSNRAGNGCGDGPAGRGKNRSPRNGAIGRPGAPHIGYPEPGDCSLRSSSCRRRLTVASLGRAIRSSGFHPHTAWPGRTVHRCECCGSDRVADRPSALHAEAPLRRGWGTRLAPTIRAGEILPDRQAPEPLLRRRPPRNFRSDCVVQALLGHQAPTLPRPTWETIYELPRIAQVPMFLRVSSLRCAPTVEPKRGSWRSLRRPSTQCGVVYPQRPRSHIRAWDAF